MALPLTRPTNDGNGRSGLDRPDFPRRFGRYVLLRLLARGGMGQVFLATTTGVEGAERPVVVKVIRREYAKDPNFLARFLDEARVQAQLQHSGVAQVLEAATLESSGDPYVVIEYVEGRSLGEIRRRIAEVGLRLSWQDAVALGALITEALAYVHERRDAAGKPLCIVHRDLSPHNVMVGYGGEVKVIDFGTARGQNRRCHTVAGVVFAKPGYVAPEVANGDSGDFRVDLYAAGVMIWELCAGRRFLQDKAADHTGAVAAGERDLPPIARRVGAPAELDRVIAQLTAFDRDDRYASTRLATSQLAALLRGAPALPNGERGTRARVAQLMYSIYPSQPGRARREFARLVGRARKHKQLESWRPPVEPEPEPSKPEESAFGERYRLRREIGRGASSVVYEAEHVELARRVAIKALDADHTCSRDFAARFRREARALSRLHHRGLVRVFDFGQASDGRLFCVMELLEGHTLRSELERKKQLGWERALKLTREICRALAIAHAHDLVHRDIKPENLFITSDGAVKLIDFGLAKAVDEQGEGAAAGQDEVGAQMGAMTLFGTPEYMAPEQVAGGRIDHRADIYALGCVLYEMLTGRLPFVADSAVRVLDAKLKGSPESVRERAPSLAIPHFVSRIVSRALARHRSRRYATALDLADATTAALAEPARRRARRRAVGASVFAAVMVFAMVLLVQQAKPWLEELPAQLRWLAPAQTQGPDQEGEDRTPAPREHQQQQRPSPTNDTPRPQHERAQDSSAALGSEATVVVK